VISRATRATQRAAVLGLLLGAKGTWVSLLEIRNCAAQYNARILELRRLGFRIENKIREIEGKRLSWFRLLSAPGQAKSPNPTGPDSPTTELPRDPVNNPTAKEASLFGDLAPGRRYPD
jgi:hypothetical protein